MQGIRLAAVLISAMVVVAVQPVDGADEQAVAITDRPAESQWPLGGISRILNLGNQSANQSPGVLPPTYADFSSDGITDDLPPLSGAFSTNPLGSAEYSIPLVLPPGRGPTEPRLAITYSDQLPTASKGPRFQLSGLSTITRCPAALSDGELRGIEFVDADQHCLDGTPLRPVVDRRSQRETGRFKPESDPNTLVEREGNGWVVSHPDGTKGFYGTSPNGQLNGPRGVLVWGLQRHVDRSGNYTTVTYVADRESSSSEFGSGELALLPLAIRYTGLNSDEVVVDPLTTVSFVYRELPRRAIGFAGGATRGLSRQLIELSVAHDRASVLGASDVVGSYRLRYEPGESGPFADALTGVRYCVKDGLCTPETSFKWTRATTDFVVEEVRGIDWTLSGEFGDFNGDGAQDIVIDEGGRIYLREAVQVESFKDFPETPRPSTWPWGPREFLMEYGSPLDGNRLIVADLQGDLRDDLIALRSDRVEVVDLNSRPPGRIRLPVPRLRNDRFVDVDGDGLLDHVGCDDNGDDTWVVRAAQPPSNTDQFRFGAPVNLIDIDCGTPPIHVDTDGNGSDELIFQTGLAWFIVSFANQDIDLEVLPIAERGLSTVIDVNGDGLADLLDTRPTSLRVALNTGEGFTGILPLALDGEFPCRSAVPTHLNSERNLELVGLFCTENRTDWIVFSVDPGLQLHRVSSGRAPRGLGSAIFQRSIDLNGDGRQEFLFAGIGDGAFLTAADHPPGEVVKEIREGRRALDNPSYEIVRETIGFSSSYRSSPTRVAACVYNYPTRCRRTGPQRIVTAYLVDVGLRDEEVRRYEVTYAALREDMRGLGSLGFEEVAVTDVAAGTVMTTVFDNATRVAAPEHYPYALTPVRTEERHAVGTRDFVRETDYEYSSKGDCPGSSLFCSPDARRRTLDGVTERSFVDEAFVSFAQANFTYDRSGFPLRVDLIPAEGGQEATILSYRHDRDAWHFGLVSAVTLRGENSNGFEIRSAFAQYWPETGLLRRWVIGTSDGPQFMTVPSGPLVDRPSAQSPTPLTLPAVQRAAEFEYDAAGNVVLARELDGTITHEHRMWWDPDFQFLQSLSRAGGVVEHRLPHPVWGGPAARWLESGTGAGLRMLEEWTYDAVGRPTLHSPAGRAPTGFRYELLPSLGMLETADSAGFEVSSETDRKGRLVRRLVREDGSLIGSESYAYDGLGRQTLVTLAEPGAPARRISYDYDEFGSISAIQTPGGARIAREWVPGTRGGGYSTTQYPDGFVVTNSYDARGRLTRFDRDGRQGLISYAPLSGPLSVSYPDGSRAQFRYDELGQVGFASDTDVGSVSVGDANLDGILALERSPWQTDSDFEYDQWGRLIATHHDGARTRLVYDDSLSGGGRVGGVENEAGNAWRRAFDSTGRPWRQEYTFRDGSSIDEELAFDSDGRVERRRISLGGSDLFVDLMYTLSTAGELESFEAQTPSGGIQLYELDGRNLSAGEVAERFHGLTRTTLFDPTTRQAYSVVAESASDGRVVQDLAYAYDELASVCVVEDGVARTRRYYLSDGQGKLTFAVDAELSALPANERQFVRGLDCFPPSPIETDGVNIIEGYGHSPSGALESRGSTNISIDHTAGVPSSGSVGNGEVRTSGSGEIEQLQGLSILHDALGRPVRLGAGESLVTLDYLPGGLSSVQATGYESFVAPGIGWVTVAEGVRYLVIEVDVLGQPVANLYLSESGDTCVESILVDHLGSPKTTLSGETVVERDWGVWGERLDKDSGSLRENCLGVGNGLQRGFAGGFDIGIEGVQIHGVRALLPEIGRFSSPDPYGRMLGNPSSVTDKWAYADSRPHALVDPSGFHPQPPLGPGECSVCDFDPVTIEGRRPPADSGPRASLPGTRTSDVSATIPFLDRGFRPSSSSARSTRQSDAFHGAGSLGNADGRDSSQSRELPLLAPSSQPALRQSYRYSWDIGAVSETWNAARAMDIMQNRPNRVFPFWVYPRPGSSGVISIGAEYDLWNAGTWMFGGLLADNTPIVGSMIDVAVGADVERNPVRVVDATDTSFTFRVLEGHFEPAGSTITFRTFERDNQVFLQQIGRLPDLQTRGAYFGWWGALAAWSVQQANLERFQNLKTGYPLPHPYFVNGPPSGPGDVFVPPQVAR